MKKIIIGTLVLVNLLIAIEYKQISIEEFKNINVLNKYGVKLKKAFDTGDIYHLQAEVKGRIQDVFLTKDKKVVLLGAAYTMDGKKMSIPVNMKPFIKDASFTFGTGSDEYVVFTDPECPYCSKFENEWDKIKDKVKFHVFLFPLDFHKNAKEMCYYILNKKTDDEKMQALHDMGAGSQEYRNNKFTVSEIDDIKSQLKAQENVANEMSVRGTPSVFDMNGKVVSWPSILKNHGINIR